MIEDITYHEFGTKETAFYSIKQQAVHIADLDPLLTNSKGFKDIDTEPHSLKTESIQTFTITSQNNIENSAAAYDLDNFMIIKVVKLGKPVAWQTR